MLWISFSVQVVRHAHVKFSFTEACLSGGSVCARVSMVVYICLGLRNKIAIWKSEAECFESASQLSI